MAYTVNQSTTGVQGVADPLVYVVKDDPLSGTINYRYVCVVKIGGVELIRLKQLPNNSNAAVFNIQDIAKNFVYQDDNPYGLGSTGLDGALNTAKIFATNGDAFKTFTVQFGYEYSATAADSPATTIEAVDQTVYCVNGTFVAATDATPFSSPASNYKLTTASNRFLSDIEPPLGQDEFTTSILYGGGTIYQHAAIAFLNGDDAGSTGSDYVHVSYYNGASALNTAYFTNEAATGGAAPGAGLSDGASLIYVGVGTYNLASQVIETSLDPSDVGNAGWTHYFVQMSSGITLATATSLPYKFERVSCGKYITDEQVFSLHWWNSKGGVDNLPMLGKVRETQNMVKQDYRTSGGNGLDADGDGTDYVRQSWEGGKRATRVQTTTTYELTTIGGSTDVLTPMIRSVVNSERVFLSGKSLFGANDPRAEGGVVQAYITDTSIEYLSGLNDQAASYTLKVEISRRRANP